MDILSYFNLSNPYTKEKFIRKSIQICFDLLVDCKELVKAMKRKQCSQEKEINSGLQPWHVPSRWSAGC